MPDLKFYYLFLTALIFTIGLFTIPRKWRNSAQRAEQLKLTMHSAPADFEAQFQQSNCFETSNNDFFEVDNRFDLAKTNSFEVVNGFETAKTNDFEMAKCNGFETVKSNGFETSKSNAFEMAKSNGFETAKSNGFETAKSDGFETAKSNGFETAKSNGFETVKSNGFETAKSNGFETVDRNGFGVEKRFETKNSDSFEVANGFERSKSNGFEGANGFERKGFVVPERIVHRCTVCFKYSSRRCSRCKSVRYCSGKCQIIHWRQGHKLECQPFITIARDSYTEEIASRMFSEQENQIYDSDIENKGRHYARHVKNNPEEVPHSKPDSLAESVDSNGDDSKVEQLPKKEERVSNLHVTERSDELQCDNALPSKLKSNHVRNVDQNGETYLGKPTDKSSCTRSSTTTTGASGSSSDDSMPSSLFEPATPSSGFWDGTIDSRKTRLDAHDDDSQSSYSDAGDTDVHAYQSSSKFDFNFRSNILPIDGQNLSPEIVKQETIHASKLGMNKAVNRAVSSEEKINGVLERKGLSSSLAKDSVCMNVNLSNDSPGLKARDSQSVNGSITPPKSCKLTSVGKDRSNDVGYTTSTFRISESKESRSSTYSIPVDHPSTTRTLSVEGAEPLKVASTHSGGASSDANHSLSGLKSSTCKIVNNPKSFKTSNHHHTLARNEVSERYTNKGLFSYDAFVKFYNWNMIEMRPCGLKNCGNSCYANVVLQCLACTPPLAAFLLQGLHSKACEKKEWCFTCEFESLLLKARKGVSPLSPYSILSEIQKIGSRLGDGREEDAHEFLRYAIDTMQSVCLKEARISQPTSLEEETTLIGLTFGGYLKSKIKCMRCGIKSERHERMMDLTVEIEGDIGTLEAALRKFTATEILDGENKYQCSRCKSYEKAKKKLKIQEAPNILTIALKRFQSGRFGKLNKSIQFPEILDLAPYMSGTSDKSPIYKLYAVVVHLDVMNATYSGHYVCYVKNLQNKWFRVDDSVVTVVERAEVLSKRAYMLLYARCSPRAPRSIKTSMTPPDPRISKNSLFKLRSLSTSSWDEPVNRHIPINCLYPNHLNFHHNRRILEDDSLSDNSSSLFSEVRSCSTESSKDSSSTDDFFDVLIGDSDQNWNTLWKQQSDSDTSSSSSSPTLYAKLSPLADSNRYSSQVKHGGADKDNNNFWIRTVPPLDSCTTKQYRNLDGSFRETDSDRLGVANIFGNEKSSLSFRRSTRERED